MKLVGYIGDRPVYEDPNAPSGIIYFVDEEFGVANGIIDMRTRWQKIKDWFRKQYETLQG